MPACSCQDKRVAKGNKKQAKSHARVLMSRQKSGKGNQETSETACLLVLAKANERREKP